jgi:N-dimethylarginine dimethylaminohydrolase
MKLTVIIEPDQLNFKISDVPDCPKPGRILMCTPDYFDVTEGINAFMYNKSGGLNRVDKSKAFVQWTDLRMTFEHLGYAVPLVKGQDGLEDMVFCANQSFPFWNFRTGRPGVILSNMRTEKRKPEVAYFAAWYRIQNYDIREVKDCAFESNGDAIWFPGKRLVIAGYGSSDKHRTDRAAFDQIAAITGAAVIGIELTHPDYYHLDTTLCILDRESCLVYPPGVGEKGMTLLKKLFSRVLTVEADEADAPNFACNAFSPDGKSVVIQKTCKNTMGMLTKAGYRAIPVDTSEFIKSGGSVYCMKLQVY